jgi:glutamine synthetase
MRSFAEQFLSLPHLFRLLRDAAWTTELLGADVKGRYADLKQASADRCPRLLGTIVKGSEVQFHHDVYNQLLWGQF